MGSLFNNTGCLPLSAIPPLLMDDIIKKMKPSAAVRMACTGHMGMYTVSRLRTKDLHLLQRVHDDYLWKGCCCERKHLLLYKILCELSQEGILNQLINRFDWMEGHSKLEIYYIVKEFFSPCSVKLNIVWLQTSLHSKLSDEEKKMAARLDYTEKCIERWNKQFQDRKVSCEKCTSVETKRKYPRISLSEPEFLRKQRLFLKSKLSLTKQNMQSKLTELMSLLQQ